MDRDRLAKVLALTTSSSDGEALAAIRKANDMLAADGLTWEQMLALPEQAVARVIVNHYHGEPFPTPMRKR